MGLPSWVTKPAGAVAKGVGTAYDYATPGSGKSTATNLGDAILDPNRVYTGSLNPLSDSFNNGGRGNASGGSAFATVSGSTNPKADVDAQVKNGAASIADPSGLYMGSSTGGANAANVAAYQDNLNALQQLLGSADTTRNNGQNSILSSYQNSLNRLQNSQNQALQGYQTQRTDTTGDYQKTLNRINDQARVGYQGLQALLGGTGSAGDILAPFAVSQQASKQRGASSDSFSRNLRDIDTAITTTNQGYDDSRNDLLTSKNSKLQELISSIDAQKQNYLSQIAAAQNQLSIAKGGGYVTPTAINSQISALQNEQANLSKQYADPVFEVRDVAAINPQLSQYQAQAASIANGNNSQAATVDDDPQTALAQLLKLRDYNQPSYSY